MSNRYGMAPRRAAAGVTAVALAVLLSACGGGDGGGNDGADKEPEKAGSASSAPSDPGKSENAGPTTPDASQTLATINGSNGFQIVVHTAVRDQGGFLTVTGTLKNTTAKMLIAPSNWNGQELNVKRTGPSLAGATLVDKVEKKRYYVLRDTEGYPLTTTGISAVKAGESISIFAQFPAPPATTSQVDFQLPLMPPATIEIS
ncbi:hypothetical protein AMK26_09225 [Streptomyces sp. CB03234]|uniref:hypothetical protein n=1 Tax=Streptomyces sp. (strain CB03234) TaxID=1703937 RepID=UPI0009395DAE|nr:hypothetical protein [Streptomyces sp. CB03234]OKK06944.1 hypothetical protein AMK26_09225 [Streptomyces sp. CB03234]